MHNGNPPRPRTDGRGGIRWATDQERPGRPVPITTPTLAGFGKRPVHMNRADQPRPPVSPEPRPRPRPEPPATGQDGFRGFDRYVLSGSGKLRHDLETGRVWYVG